MAKAVTYSHSVLNDSWRDQQPPFLYCQAKDGWSSTGTGFRPPFMNPTHSNILCNVGGFTTNDDTLGIYEEGCIVWVPLSGIYLINYNMGVEAPAASVRVFTSIYKVAVDGSVFHDHSRTGADSPDTGGWTAINNTMLTYIQKGNGFACQLYCSSQPVGYFADHTNLHVMYVGAMNTNNWTDGT